MRAQAMVFTVRWVVTPALALGVLIACNALSGAGDLAVCNGAACSEAARRGPLDGSTGPGAGDGGIYQIPEPLPATCTAGQKVCDARLVATCTGTTWTTSPCPETCLSAVCAPWPSCRGDVPSAGCGPHNASCCESTRIPGGTFNRLNSAQWPATVSPFSLDVYEVTVSRFRLFVDAGGGTQAAPPPTGFGAHPKIPGSGWQSTWNTALPATTDDLKDVLAGGTWTPDRASNESRPITNVSWFLAFAFCAWDGGRLPTLAEWSFAASNGSEQRVYPWSSPPGDTTIDPAHAAYTCAVTSPPNTCPPPACSISGLSCTTSECTDNVGTCTPQPCFGCTAPDDIAPVGSLGAGVGAFGQLDLAGNVAEHVLDATNTGKDPPPTCSDCALLMGAQPHGPGPGASTDYQTFVLNGGWQSPASDVRNTVFAMRLWKEKADNTIGVRCARD